jgi:hypothetical protein
MMFFAAIALTGRSRPFVEIFIAGIVLFIGGNVAANYALSFDQQQSLGRGITILLGLTTLLGTAWLFVLSRRRAMVAASSAWTCLAVWVLLAAGIGTAKAFEPQMPIAACLLMAGLAGLVVAPIAAAPLAIAWNRTR